MMPAMPKPTLKEIADAVANVTLDTAVMNVAQLIDCAWEGAPQADVEPDDLEQHNREQRIRREAYVEALEAEGAIYGEEPSVRAARRYPLRKRVPKVIGDPHGFGRWRAETDANADCLHAVWREGEPAVGYQPDVRYLPMLITPERLRVLVALLDDPWTYEEDTSVEGSAT